MAFYNIEGFSNYLLGKGEGDNEWSVWRIKKNGELKKVEGSILRSGHILYGLRSDGKQVGKYLHRLIAEMFLPIPTELKESGERLDAHHIDGNPQNNSIENLVWLTESEHRRLHKKGKPHSEEHKRKISEGQTKKEVFQYSLDWELVRVWPSTMECGRNGFDQSSVVSCCLGERNKHKGFKWSYNPPPLTNKMY